VLVPWRAEKKEEVFEALLKAAQTGEISAQRLNEAVQRVLAVKISRGVLAPLAPRAERLKGLGARKDLATQIAEAGLTVLKNDARVLPLKGRKRILVVTAEKALLDGLTAVLANVRVKSLVVPAIPASNARNDLKLLVKQLAQQADVIVVGVVNSRQLELVTMAALTQKPVVAVVMGNPYLASQIHDAKAILVTYSYRREAGLAAANCLTGLIGSPGKLPVSLPFYKFGAGLNLKPGPARATKLNVSREPGMTLH
jgi:beta-N-acetylhexosaminidase